MFELSESKVYEFDEFRLDAKSHRLFRRATGEPVPLTPKAVELLLALIESEGRVLTKDELLKTVWGNSFVEESNLSQTIFVLRKTLGENKKEPHFILTVPNRGYRFIASVREIKPSTDAEIHESESIEFESQFELEDRKPKTEALQEILHPKTARSVWLAVPLVLLLMFGVYWFYPTSKPATLREIKSIAVLPFEDLSADQTEKYLGVSLADALVSRHDSRTQHHA